MIVHPELFPQIPPEEWQWVHRFPHDVVEEVSHPRHQNWMPINEKEADQREIMVPIEGEHFYGVRGRLFCARPGSIFLFDHKERHDGGYSPFQPDCRDLWIIFQSRREALVRDMICRRMHMDGTSSSDVTTSCSLEVEGAFPEVVYESWNRCAQDGGTPTSIAQLKAAVTTLILHAASICLKPNPDQSSTGDQKMIVDKVKKYIHANLSGDLSLTNLADKSGYAAHYFHVLFRRHVGCTLHQYVNNARLYRAKELLTSGQSVQSISEEVGFATAAYFSRFFKNATGRSPIHWKEHRIVHMV